MNNCEEEDNEGDDVDDTNEDKIPLVNQIIS